MNESRLCAGCKHLKIETEVRGYGEYTPGSAAKIYCDLEHWDDVSYELADFAANMAKAGKCPDFELANDLHEKFPPAKRLDGEMGWRGDR